MTIDVKAKPGLNNHETNPTLKTLYKWMGYGMIVAVLWSLFKNGLIAPYFQEIDYNEFITPENAISSGVTEQVIVQVSSNSVDAFGGPFDGFSLGSVVGPIFAALELTTPPDLVACLIFLSADQATCSYRQKEKRYLSTCHNAYDCDWAFNVPANEPYAVVIFDIDTGWNEGTWDLVDYIIVGESNNERNGQLDHISRLFTEIASPTTMTIPRWLTDIIPGDWSLENRRFTFNQAESDRRERGIAVLSKNRAAEGVSLSQSSIYIFSNQ